MARQAVLGLCATQQAAAFLRPASRVNSAESTTSQGPMKVRVQPLVSCLHVAAFVRHCHGARAYTAHSDVSKSITCTATAPAAMLQAELSSCLCLAGCCALRRLRSDHGHLYSSRPLARCHPQWLPVARGTAWQASGNVSRVAALSQDFSQQACSESWQFARLTP